MAAQSLDHVNIVTDDLEGTIAFYTDIIGLKNGERPPFDNVGAWIIAATRRSSIWLGSPE